MNQAQKESGVGLPMFCEIKKVDEAVGRMNTSDRFTRLHSG